MKAGTTWLYDYLSDFEQVAASPLKEVHYFDALYRKDYFKKRVDKNWRHLRDLVKNEKMHNMLEVPLVKSNIERLYMQYNPDAYLQHFHSLEGDLTTHYCDITPSYALLPIDGFRAIKKMISDASLKIKIIFILRDPIDRHWSQIRFDIRKNNIKTPRDYFCTLDNHHWLERGRYDLTIGKLHECFDEDEIFVGFYEKLFSIPEIEKLHRFLELTTIPYQPAVAKMVGQTKLQAYMPDDFFFKALDRYSYVYDWCEKYFKDDLPNSWHTDCKY